MRSQVMKKYMLANQKELYAILRSYEFMQHMKDNILPTGIVINILMSEVTD